MKNVLRSKHVNAIVSPARKRAQASVEKALAARPVPHVYCPSALVANADGMVEYENLPFAANCLLEEITHLFKQMTGAPPRKQARVKLVAEIEF